MKIKKSFFPAFLLSVAVLSSLQLGMARKGIYDEEARETQRWEHEQAKNQKSERQAGPARNIVGGVKQATVDSTKGLIQETAEHTAEDAPVKGTFEGVSQGAEKALDQTLKGALKVATLGYGELKNYEIEEPESGSGEPTKIKIKIPGT